MLLNVTLCYATETNLTIEVEDNLNDRKPDLRAALSKVRLWLAQQRCEKSLQHLPAQCTPNLALVNQAYHVGLQALSEHRIFIKIPKQTQYYLVNIYNISSNLNLQGGS